MPDYKTPGVFIEEMPATGPIAGVGTSTAAFIGPAKQGPINVPIKVTNWTQFKDMFGDFMIVPRTYLAYAVRSFFENGGTMAYVVRAGNAVRAFKDLPDAGGSGKFALRLEAREEGPGGNQIVVEVTHSSIATGVKVRKARAQIKDNAPKDVLNMKSPADAAKFVAGDWVTIESGTERAQVMRVLNDQIFLVAPLTGTYTGSDWVRLADIGTSQRSFRVESATGVEAGSAIHLNDNASSGAQEEDAVVASVSGEWVTLDAAPTKIYKLGHSDPQPSFATHEFDLKLSKPGAATNDFPKLAMDPRHSRYWSRVVSSPLAAAVQPDPANRTAELPPKNRPAATGATVTKLAGGVADAPPPAQTHFENALNALERVDDVNILCVPDRNDPAFQNKVVAHCEKLGDRFAVLDSALNETPFDPTAANVLAHRGALSSKNGFAALYYPWLAITDPASPTGEDVISIPPSGAVAGIYARSDATVGVHKAPANEEIRNGVGLERTLTDAEQGELNVDGVNVLRMFPGVGRPMVWGARTLAPKENTAWRYVNVRRLLLYIEESIQEGLRPMVFDPNDLGLWKRLDRTIGAFLTGVWRAGALFGATAEDAYYIKIDEENNPEPVRALGQVVIEIGVAPVRPAEFIIVRIGLWAGASEVTE